MNKFERLFNAMTRPWVIVLWGALIVLFVGVLDQPITEAVHAIQPKLPLSGLRLLTFLGWWPLYCIGLAVLALSCRIIFQKKQLEKRVWFLWLCVVVANCICVFLKIGFGRARPDVWFSQHIYGFYGPHKSSLYWSFPSGHTTTIMSVMFGLCVLFPRHCVAFIVFGLMVVGSRILLTQHYVGDVLFASYLALIEVGLLYHWTKSRLLMCN